MPDISKINNVAVADISKLDAVTFADGQKVNNQDVSLITDAHTLISTHTASSSSSLDITSGIDSTFDVFQWVFTNMHPQSDAKFAFQFDTGTNTNYNQTMTTTFFYAWHKEDDSSAGMGYAGSNDQAEGTAYQPLSGEIVESSDADSSISGILTLYDPSSSTYVKHFTAVTTYFQQDPALQNAYTAGYVNTTTALTRISFKFESGNIDSGVIKMYGIAKS
jgi:hypothetical protein